MNLNDVQFLRELIRTYLYTHIKVSFLEKNYIDTSKIFVVLSVSMCEPKYVTAKNRNPLNVDMACLEHGNISRMND